MLVFTSPFKYLRLRNERGTRLAFRDLLPVLIITAIFSAPFILLDQVNFFRPTGFVDRIGSLAAVLAGFYIAALVAVGSFSASIGDLDSPITNGKIFLHKNDDTSLTRREYICAVFGFLSFLSLFIAIASSFILIIAPSLSVMASGRTVSLLGCETSPSHVLRYISIFLYCLTLSMMIVTTFYGLYYLTDRIYAKSPKILPKSRKIEDD